VDAGDLATDAQTDAASAGVRRVLDAGLVAVLSTRRRCASTCTSGATTSTCSSSCTLGASAKLRPSHARRATTTRPAGASGGVRLVLDVGLVGVVGERLVGFRALWQLCRFARNPRDRGAIDPLGLCDLLLRPTREPPLEDPPVARGLRVLVGACQPVADGLDVHELGLDVRR
jgi:hypothetical protein